MKTAKIIAATLTAVVTIEIVLRLLLPTQALWLDLDFPPDESRVMTIGNSMFKTGLDPERFEQMTEQPLDFNYFDGYYSNLWYLIMKNAISPAEQHPKALIWGFRPNYANIPAFRQRKAGRIEHFRLADEPLFEAISASTDLPWTERVDVVLSRSRLYTLRGEARTLMLNLGKHAMLRLLGIFDPFYREAVTISRVRSTTVGDLLLAAVTRNQVQMSEELVADVAGIEDSRFISGERVPFDHSFVPYVAEIVEAAGIPQLVVIFKPVTEVQGSTPEEVTTFKNQALDFFAQNGIPVANVFDDLELSIDDYGSGDHYNSSGRAKVTDFIAAVFSREVQQD